MLGLRKAIGELQNNPLKGTFIVRRPRARRLAHCAKREMESYFVVISS